MPRFSKNVVKAAPETKDYKILLSFTHKHVIENAGTILALTEDEAKYHLLAGRIVLVSDVVADEPKAPAEKAESKKDGK